MSFKIGPSEFEGWLTDFLDEVPTKSATAKLEALKVISPLVCDELRPVFDERVRDLEPLAASEARDFQEWLSRFPREINDTKAGG